MSLVPDYEDSSNSSSQSDKESSSETENTGTSKEIEQAQSTKYKLPTPTFGEVKQDADGSKSSVFKNPFTEAENAKEAILQKHVKMVDTKENVVIINGKKICWNYRKGRCRFGHNCKFAHDSDVQKTKDQVEAEKQVAIQNSVVCQSGQLGQNQNVIPQPPVQEELEQRDLKQNKQKHKRPGLSQGLIPGKKVMKQYIKNQKI